MEWRQKNQICIRVEQTISGHLESDFEIKETESVNRATFEIVVSLEGDPLGWNEGSK